MLRDKGPTAATWYYRDMQLTGDEGDDGAHHKQPPVEEGEEEDEGHKRGNHSQDHECCGHLQTGLHCMYMYACTCIYTYTYIHVHTYMYIHTVHVRVHVCVCVIG